MNEREDMALTVIDWSEVDSNNWREVCKVLQACFEKLEDTNNQLLQISGDLSELQDTFGTLIDEAYDVGCDEGYKEGCEEMEKKLNETN